MKMLKRLGRLARVLALGRYPLSYDRVRYTRQLNFKQRTNFVLSSIEANLRRINTSSYPFALQLEPTTQCQLDCTLCPRIRANSRHSIGHMDYGNYERLIRELGPYLLAIAFWQWGEPLLHPRIIEMVRLAHELGIMTMISTNGQVDPVAFDLRALFEAGLDLLIISMDGASQNIYQKFRKGGRVEFVRRFIRAAAQAKRDLQETKPYINLRIIATSENEQEVDRVRAIAKEDGADFFSVKSVSLYYDDDPGDSRLPIEKSYRSFQYRGANEADSYRRMPNLCAKPWTWPTLRYDGTLLVCECDHSGQQELGNVFQASSFREIWRGKRARALRRHFNREGRIDLEFCHRCRYKLDDAIRIIDADPSACRAPDFRASLDPI
jgi:MoaA/NifB/PqqE/SkfB family radical SAM enzyme